MIRRLYEVEDRARPLDDDARRGLRQAEAVPILERLREELDRLSSRLLAQIGVGAGGDVRIEPMAGVVPVYGGRPADDRQQRFGASAERPGDRSEELVVPGERRGGLACGSPMHDYRWGEASSARAIGRTCVDVILQLSVDSSREYLESLLPDRWALAHPEHVLNHRVEESREKARSRDQRREARRRQSM